MGGLFKINGGGINKKSAWTAKANMPVVRTLLTTATVNGKIYIIGGRSGDQFAEGSPLNRVDCYDPTANTYTQKANMPSTLSGMTCAATGNYIYVFGGCSTTTTPVNTTYRYDTVNNTWATMATMPVAKTYAAAVTVGTKIYVIGGAADYNTIGTGTNTAYCYDTATNTWSTKAVIPVAVSGAAVGVKDDTIYVLSGRYTNYNSGTVFRYNTTFNTWTSDCLSSSVQNRILSAYTQIDDRIYLFGGHTGNSYLSLTESYHIPTDTWLQEANSPLPVFYCSASAVGGKIYLFGGTTSADVRQLNTNNCLDPAKL